jgi:hypothetical protein
MDGILGLSGRHLDRLCCVSGVKSPWSWELGGQEVRLELEGGPRS